MAGPQRVVSLGYVNLGQDGVPEAGKEYPLVSASSAVLKGIPFPNATARRRLSLDLLKFYVDDLPDFTSKNEGLFKVQVTTQDPQNINGTTIEAAFTTEFNVKDENYAPAFLYRGVFRNVLFRDLVNLRFDLYEIDKGLQEGYQKLKSVIDKVPEVKNLDILKGIPYIDLAGKLFSGIVEVFGKNADDHIWGEFPLLELDPGPGGAFLRTGIYVVFENKNKNQQNISVNQLRYKDEFVIPEDGLRLPNHVIFNTKLTDHVELGQSQFVLVAPSVGKGDQFQWRL